MTLRPIFCLACVTCLPFSQAQEINNPVTEVDDLSDAIMVEASPQIGIDEQDSVIGEGPSVVLELPGQEGDQGLISKGDDDVISVDFPDEDVRSIIINVADLYGLNVVIPEALVGRVTLKLRNVTWQQVFDVILEPLSYTYVEEGNIIKIKSILDLQQEPVDTNVFIINFSTAAEMQSAIAPMVDETVGGRIQVDSRTNSIVITERPSRISSIKRIIERLDKPTEQVMIESKFVEVKNADVSNLGINWTSLSGYEVGVGEIGREWEKNVTSVSSNGSVLNEDGTVSPNGIDSYSKTISRMDTAVFSADDFNVVLSALETKNDVELVSNPTVVTLNNTEAQINIGEEYPIPEYTYNDQTGNFAISGFEYKPIGIILNVTPQVNDADFINLDIQPEISSQNGQVTFDGAEIPIISTRKTKSVVTIKDGYTLAIGGLIEKTVDNLTTKVPVLGDIPFLGRVFQSESMNESQRNLIIFITAKTLNNEGASYEEVFSKRDLDEMGIESREVPGYEGSEKEQKLFDEIQRLRDQLSDIETETRLKQQMHMMEMLQMDEEEDQAVIESRIRSEKAAIKAAEERALRNEEQQKRKKAEARMNGLKERKVKRTF